MVFDEILRAIQFPEIGAISACPLKSSEFLSFCSFGLFLSYFISNRMQVCRIIYLCIILLVCNSMHITIRDFIPTATEEVPSSILQFHKDVIIILDKEAASLLNEDDYELMSEFVKTK